MIKNRCVYAGWRKKNDVGVNLCGEMLAKMKRTGMTFQQFNKNSHNGIREDAERMETGFQMDQRSFRFISVITRGSIILNPVDKWKFLSVFVCDLESGAREISRKDLSRRS